MKKCLLLKINTITNFLTFRMKYIIDKGCLFDYWYLKLFYYPNA